MVLFVGLIVNVCKVFVVVWYEICSGVVLVVSMMLVGIL